MEISDEEINKIKVENYSRIECLRPILDIRLKTISRYFREFSQGYCDYKKNCLTVIVNTERDLEFSHTEFTHREYIILLDYLKRLKRVIYNFNEEVANELIKEVREYLKLVRNS